jgi:hypothetical protein
VDDGLAADVLHRVGRARCGTDALLVMRQGVHEHLDLGHRQAGGADVRVGVVGAVGVGGEVEHVGGAPIEDETQLLFLLGGDGEGELNVRLGCS